MKLRTKLTAIVLLLMVVCSGDDASTVPQPSKARPEPSIRWSPDPSNVSDDLAVLRAVLEIHCLKSDGKYVIVISDPGELGRDYRPPSEVSEEAAADLVRRNSDAVILPAGLGCSGVRVATEAEVEAAFANHPPDPDRAHIGWEGFYAAYPKAHGLVRLSRPGYASGGRIAVVYMSASAGLRAGFGWTLVLRKLAGKWKVVERHAAWIA